MTKERKSFKITTFFAKLLTDDSLLLSCSKNRIPLTAGGLCRLKCEKKKEFFLGEERGASPLLDKSLLFRHFLSLTVLRHATPKLNIVVWQIRRVKTTRFNSEKKRKSKKPLAIKFIISFRCGCQAYLYDKYFSFRIENGIVPGAKQVIPFFFFAGINILYWKAPHTPKNNL